MDNKSQQKGRGQVKRHLFWGLQTYLWNGEVVKFTTQVGNINNS